MQHFFLKPENFHGEQIEITESPTLHQLTRVLRIKTGDELMVLDNSGDEFLCRIEQLNENKTRLRIIEKRKNAAEPEIFITLYQSLPKKMELFEWVLQKGTEIGVSRFVPIKTERTQRHEFSKRDRLEKILKEAAEQCERGKIPELIGAQKFTEALANADGQQKFILHGRGDHPLLSKVITKQTSVDVFIGPEGGFTESEIQQAEKNGVIICSLGPRILRTETAAIVATGIILSHA
ncbi:16S rRNA (uracil(1498)-N(3))-methyltransferase [Candidatus Peregrinibacteria bacterium]|nr:16S rRNA (uracil(1498)-N(3))-methyltransferase [Candidatus Peregrinibacteria bacterium]